MSGDRATPNHENAGAGTPGAPDSAQRVKWRAPRERRHTLLTIALGVVLVMSVVYAFHHAVGGAFVFDDMPGIRDNGDIREIRPFQHYFGYWHRFNNRPIVELSLAINYQISEWWTSRDGGWANGLHTDSYHAFNLGVHALNALLLFVLLRRITGMLRGPARMPWLHATVFAFGVALVWGVHPMHTNVICHAIQRAEALSSTWLLLVLLIGHIAATKSMLWLLWLTPFAVLFALLGLLTKANAAVAPLAAILIDRFLVSGRWLDTLKRLPMYAVVFIALAWVDWNISGSVSRNLGHPRFEFGAANATVGFNYKGITWLEYLLNQPRSIWRYVSTAIWPDVLVLDYGMEAQRFPRPGRVNGEAVPLTLLDKLRSDVFLNSLAGGIPLAILFLSSVTLVWFRKWAWLGVTLFLFFFLLAPTSSIIPIRDLYFEHRAYMASATVLILLAAGLWWLDRVLARSFNGATRLALFALVIGTYAGLGTMRTWQRSFDYTSARRLYTRDLQARPEHDRILMNLGVDMMDRGGYHVAVDIFEDAYRINKYNRYAVFNYGIALRNVGRPEESVRILSEQAHRFVKSWRVYEQIAISLRRMGKPLAAVEALNLELAKDRRAWDPTVWAGRGNAWADAAMKTDDEQLAAEYRANALEDFRQAVERGELRRERGRIDRDVLASIYYNLGNIHFLRAEWDECIEAYERAEQLHPHHHSAGRFLEVARRNKENGLTAEDMLYQIRAERLTRGEQAGDVPEMLMSPEAQRNERDNQPPLGPLLPGDD